MLQSDMKNINIETSNMQPQDTYQQNSTTNNR